MEALRCWSEPAWWGTSSCRRPGRLRLRRRKRRRRTSTVAGRKLAADEYRSLTVATSNTREITAVKELAWPRGGAGLRGSGDLEERFFYRTVLPRDLMLSASCS